MTAPGSKRPAEDPGLPIKFGPCSNGEYVPAPLTAVEGEAIRRARWACDENAKRVGMSRPEFLRSVCGAATTLLSLQTVWLEAAKHGLGGFWEIPSEGALEAASVAILLAAPGRLSTTNS